MHRNSREEPFDLLLRQALQQETTEKQQEEQRALTRTNNLLKAELQRREQCRSISLWFLPGALHALLLGLFALAICLLAEWWFVQLAAVVLALAGSLAGWRAASADGCGCASSCFRRRCWAGCSTCWPAAMTAGPAASAGGWWTRTRASAPAAARNTRFATRAAAIRRICRRLTSRPAAATGAFWRQCL